MRCPHCGYHSFDDLSACKKCGKPLLARYSAGKPKSAVEGELFRPEELKKRAEIFSNHVSGLSGVSPLLRAEKKRKIDSTTEQMVLPSFLLDDPHVTTNNWSGWTVADSGQPPVHLLWKRFLATLIDLIILCILLMSFAAVAGQLLDWTTLQWLENIRQNELLRLAAYLLVMVTVFSYFFIGHYGSGQTFGKVVCGLQLVSVDGSDVTLSQVILRSTATVVSLLCLGAGFFSLWRDEQQRGWSDRFAGTRIVDVRSDDMNMSEEPITEVTQ
nr:RDD family protein [uncultured Desulfuromonas sp.]